MQFNEAEHEACRRLVGMGLAEDLGKRGDVTTEALIPGDSTGQAVLVARSAGVVAGLPAVELVLKEVQHRFWYRHRWDFLRFFQVPSLGAAAIARVVFEPFVEDGVQVKPGEQLARVSGPSWKILVAERLALNILQHLSGIATLTRRYVEAVAGLPCQILDTRKTLPGWRLLQKYAVRCGGGRNHRFGLHDGILIKDNHLAFLGSGPETISQVIMACDLRRRVDVPLEIEVDTLEQFDQALMCLPGMVLLDNMECDQLREAVRRRNAKAPKVLLEVSGGVTLATVRAIAETGVDRISVGALTHSAPALDIGLDYLL
jgi:nicotinate-nucleotide pyrophosphorylase (carboxylating)